MIIQKFSVNNHPIQTLLSWVISNEIAIPEIQKTLCVGCFKGAGFNRFTYKGFPIGYIIAWQNPAVRLKDGSSSKGKKILIDGQQRISALMAAILGKEIIDKDYQRKRIVIAFNPDEMIF